MNHNSIQQYTIKELFSSDNNYVIPIYQRDYAWENSEITQLIQDIVDCKKYRGSQPYYIGTLIVYERNKNNKTVFEVIDGQQRLTTLTILLSFIKANKKYSELNWYKKLNLDFDNRKKSTNALEYIFNNYDNKECKE